MVEKQTKLIVFYKDGERESYDILASKEDLLNDFAFGELIIHLDDNTSEALNKDEIRKIRVIGEDEEDEEDGY